MRIMLAIALSVASIQSTSLFAGPGHGHSHSHKKIESDEAKKIASKAMDKLIEKKKIDEAWKGIEPNKPYQKDFGKGTEWVVTFDNPKIKDDKKKKLYVFVSLDGHVLGSNFTGN